ncbi:MAG: nitroreductase [Dehalococcoidia bacterium]|nr:nitroreductase [Dehalococcoidia bacterium]
MNVLDAIVNRRTTKEFRPEPVPRAVLQQIIDTAAWAPNHHMTAPWRIIVLEGAARMPIAELRRALKARELTAKGLPPDEVERQATDSAQKLLRAPTLLVVSCAQNGDAVQREEDFAAAAAAVQNMLLAATALGVATFWTSGPIALSPELKALLDLPPSDRVVGIIHVGYPAEHRSPGQKPPPATRWVEPREVPQLVRRVEAVMRNGRHPVGV